MVSRYYAIEYPGGNLLATDTDSGGYPYELTLPSRYPLMLALIVNDDEAELNEMVRMVKSFPDLGLRIVELFVARTEVEVNLND